MIIDVSSIGTISQGESFMWKLNKIEQSTNSVKYIIIINIYDL